mmetsp:Transcript_34669/g.54306  ORF Transcript_34669/g.54306 Transcript_34669/m.54306 type:complete len:200 (-) Transcript_34669:403-1002(-)
MKKTITTLRRSIISQAIIKRQYRLAPTPKFSRPAKLHQQQKVHHQEQACGGRAEITGGSSHSNVRERDEREHGEQVRQEQDGLPGPVDLGDLIEGGVFELPLEEDHNQPPVELDAVRLREPQQGLHDNHERARRGGARAAEGRHGRAPAVQPADGHEVQRGGDEACQPRDRERVHGHGRGRRREQHGRVDEGREDAGQQ